MLYYFASVSDYCQTDVSEPNATMYITPDAKNNYREVNVLML